MQRAAERHTKEMGSRVKKVSRQWEIRLAQERREHAHVISLLLKQLQPQIINSTPAVPGNPSCATPGPPLDTPINMTPFSDPGNPLSLVASPVQDSDHNGCHPRHQVCSLEVLPRQRLSKIGTLKSICRMPPGPVQLAQCAQGLANAVLD